MYRWCLSISLLGIFLLSLFLTNFVAFDPELVDSSLVSFEGKVISQRISSGALYLTTADAVITCNCFGNYVGKTVFVKGSLDRFEGRTYIRAFEISVLD